MDEEGTEAAAATAVLIEMNFSYMPSRKRPPPKFVADHPFAFVLLSNAAEEQQSQQPQQQQQKMLLFNGIFQG